MIEVWEKLDCESVGKTEIEAVETVVRDRYGTSAVDPPMVIARLLADEGAELRHSELMQLHIVRAGDRPYDSALRGLMKLGDLKTTLQTLANLENLRKKLAVENDKQGLRLLREAVIHGKNDAIAAANRKSADAVDSHIGNEIANWLTIWLQTPDTFEEWVALRQRSTDFADKFGRIM